MQQWYYIWYIFLIIIISFLKGFAPTDSFELANADMIVDGLVDVMTKVMKFAFEKDEEKKVTGLIAANVFGIKKKKRKLLLSKLAHSSGHDIEENERAFKVRSYCFVIVSCYSLPRRCLNI